MAVGERGRWRRWRKAMMCYSVLHRLPHWFPDEHLSSPNGGGQLWEVGRPPWVSTLSTQLELGTDRWRVGERVEEGPGAESKIPTGEQSKLTQRTGLGLMWTELSWWWHRVMLARWCPLWPGLSLQGCGGADRVSPKRKNKKILVDWMLTGKSCCITDWS